MKTYYIYKEFPNMQYHNRESFNSHWTNFVLTTNKGNFFGDGNFCGYYSNSGYSGAHILGETVTEYVFDANGDCTCKYHIKNSTVRRDIDDTFSTPAEIEAVDDAEAFQIFENFCLENMNTW